MAGFTSIALGTGALLGGAAGAAPKKSKQRQSVELAPEDFFEREGRELAQEQFHGIQQFLQGDPRLQEARKARQGLAASLQQLAQTGGLPTQADITQAGATASQLLAPERVALQQAFRRQETEFGREAARLGRTTDDQILRAKLAQQQTQAEERLGARQGALRTQLAQLQPERRLAFQRAGAEELEGIANQAFRNKQFLFGLGRQIQGQEFQRRFAVAPKFGQTESGGGLGGALTGAIGGAGLGLGAAGGFQSFQTGGLQNQLLQAQLGAAEVGVLGPGTQLPAAAGGGFGGRGIGAVGTRTFGLA